MIYERVRHNSVIYPNKVAIIEDNSAITYSQLVKIADIISDLLVQYKVTHNNNIICFMKTSKEAVASILAVNRIGGIFIPISTNLRVHATGEYIDIIEPKVILTSHMHLDRFLAHSKDMTIICVDINGQYLNYEIYSKMESRKGIIDTKQNFTLSINNMIDQREDNIAEILFTSGTTGIPKGIMLSNHNICSNVEDIINYIEINPSDKSLIVKQLSHSSTLNGEIITTLYIGATIVTTQKLITQRLIIQYIYKYNVTVLFLVPTLLNMVLKFIYDTEECLRPIRIINFYGSTVSERLLLMCLEKLEHTEVIYSYGLSEAAPRVSFIKSKDIRTKLGSSGISLQHVRISILNDVGGEINIPNEVGEIYVNGPNIMIGYYKNEELTKKTLTEHGLKTGDLGYMDEDGYLYVLGRKDEMIIKAGVNIYPAEIENAISRCSFVNQVLVKGIEDKTGLGQRIQAIVVCNDKTVTESDKIKNIFNYCKMYLEPGKIPDEIVLSEQLELTQTGKIKRK